VDLSQPPDHASEDFALVARIFDQTTGRPVLVVAGLGANGTTAAVQFLLDPARTAELTAHAPRNWQRLNMEAVVRTQILDNHAGPPHLVVCTFW
jgi:cysteine synthase